MSVPEFAQTSSSSKPGSTRIPSSPSSSSAVKQYTSLQDALANSISYNYLPENIYRGVGPVSPLKKTGKRSSGAVSVDEPARKRPRHEDGEENHEPGSWVLMKTEDDDEEDVDDLVRLFVVGPTGHPAPTHSIQGEPPAALTRARTLNTRFLRSRVKGVEDTPPTLADKEAVMVDGEKDKVTDKDETDSPVEIRAANVELQKLIPRQGWLVSALAHLGSKKKRVPPPLSHHPFLFVFPRISPGVFLPSDPSSTVDPDAVHDSEPEIFDLSEHKDHDIPPLDTDAKMSSSAADIDMDVDAKRDVSHAPIAVLDDNEGNGNGNGEEGVVSDDELRIDELMDDTVYGIQETSISAAPWAKRTPRRKSSTWGPAVATPSPSASASASASNSRRTAALRTRSSARVSPAKPVPTPVSTPKTKSESKVSTDARKEKVQKQEEGKSERVTRSTAPAEKAKDKVKTPTTFRPKKIGKAKASSASAGKEKTKEDSAGVQPTEPATANNIHTKDASFPSPSAGAEEKVTSASIADKAEPLSPESSSANIPTMPTGVIAPTISSSAPFNPYLNLYTRLQRSEGPSSRPPSSASVSSPPSNAVAGVPTTSTSSSPSGPQINYATTSSSSAVVSQPEHPNTSSAIVPHQPMSLALFQQSLPAINALPVQLQSYLLHALALGVGTLPPALGPMAPPPPPAAPAPTASYYPHPSYSYTELPPPQQPAYGLQPEIPTHAPYGSSYADQSFTQVASTQAPQYAQANQNYNQVTSTQAPPQYAYAPYYTPPSQPTPTPASSVSAYQNPSVSTAPPPATQQAKPRKKKPTKSPVIRNPPSFTMAEKIEMITSTGGADPKGPGSGTGSARKRRAGPIVKFGAGRQQDGQNNVNGGGSSSNAPTVSSSTPSLSMLSTSTTAMYPGTISAPITFRNGSVAVQPPPSAVANKAQVRNGGMSRADGAGEDADAEGDLDLDFYVPTTGDE